MNYINKITKFSLVAVASTLLTSCSEEKPTTYVEKVSESTDKISTPLAVNKKIEMHQNSDLPAPSKAQEGEPTWTTPSTWGEERTGGMIMAKFSIPNIQDSRCYITQLRGNGGGLEPNIQRWLGQLGLPHISAKTEMAKFIAKQNEFRIADANVLIVDFTSLGEENSKSMVVGVVSYDDITMYVKLQGPKSEIAKHKADLVALTKSIVR